MIIYKDLITGDEIISDAYDLLTGDTDGLWEVDCRKITVGGESFDTGANESAEEASEALEDAAETVIDVVHSFHLNSYPRPDKKNAQAYYKKYAKAVLAKLKEKGLTEQEEKFKTTAPAAIKKIMANWNDYDVYIGENAEPEEGTWVLMNFREDGITPYATVWRYAFEEYKV